MSKIQQKFDHEYLNQTRTVTVQDLTMLSHIDPRVNTLQLKVIIHSLQSQDPTALNTPLIIEEKRSALPVRILKWLSGSKNRIKISVKMGNAEIIHFYAKNRSQAERNLKLAHYLNTIVQSGTRKDKEAAIKSAEVFVRSAVHLPKERNQLLKLIQSEAGEILHTRIADEPHYSAEVRHLESVLAHIKNGDRLFEHEKFNLEELAQLLYLEKAPKEFQPKNLKKVLDELRSLVDKHTLLQNGDIGLTDIDKKNKLDQEELNSLERLFKILLHSPYIHSQMFIKGKIHHVVKEYRASEVNLKLQAQCVFLRVHPEELLNENPKIIDALKKKYGANYRAAIDAKFRKIQDDLHNRLSDDKNIKGGGRFTKVKNKYRYMIKTGLAHWIKPLQKRLRKSTKDIEAAHLRVYGEEPLKKAKYHCTEFVAEVTLASLFELEKQMQRELGEEFSETPIIQFPFSERERVRFLDPARLIAELKKSGAISQVPANPVLVELLKQEDLDWSDPDLFSGLISRPSPKIIKN